MRNQIDSQDLGIFGDNRVDVKDDVSLLNIQFGTTFMTGESIKLINLKGVP